MTALCGGVLTSGVFLALGQEQAYQTQVFSQTVKPTGLYGMGKSVQKFQNRVKGFVAERFTLRPWLQHGKCGSRFVQLLLQ
jgi:hypothetical protein